MMQEPTKNLKQNLNGTVKSAELCDGLENVQVVRKDIAGHIVEITETDSNGKWQLKNVLDTDTITFTKEGFVAKSFLPQDLPVLTGPVYHDVKAPFRRNQQRFYSVDKQAGASSHSRLVIRKSVSRFHESHR